MILFSVDEASTFENANALRKKIERAKDVDSFPMVLVGNKCDKPNREITKEQGTEKAAQLRCPYIETSAKSGVRILHYSYTLKCCFNTIFFLCE